MARSTYVYVVLSSHEPIAAFTVKHELVTAVQRAIDRCELSVLGLRVHRFYDGDIGGPVNVTDQFTWSIPSATSKS